MIVWCAIDPGYINFSLSILNLKINFLVNFLTSRNFYKHINLYINNFLDYLKKKFANISVLKIAIEKQLSKFSKQNSNMEFYLKGIFSAYKDICIEIYDCPGYFKNIISKKNFDWNYEKIRSRKAFCEKVMTNKKLYEKIKDWTIFKFELKNKNTPTINKEIINDIYMQEFESNFIIIRLKDFLKLIKFDDFLDTFFILEAITHLTIKYLFSKHNHIKQ